MVTVTPIFAKGDVVLVTGGARGVTAATAIALARSSQPTLVLLGRSKLAAAEPEWAQGIAQDGALKKAILEQEFGGKASPKDIENRFKELQAHREVRSTLAAIEAAGSRVEYRSVDVRSEKAVDKLLNEVQGTLGKVQGIVHGAGVLADKRIEEKTDEMFDSVFSTKVTGLKLLLGPLQNQPLKAIVLFSSVTARFGRPGQVENYRMANDLLNKTAQLEAKRRPECRVVSLNWGPWGGGMVTEGLKKEFQRLGVGLIDLDAGAEAMVKELSAATGGAVEILYGRLSGPARGFPARSRALSSGGFGRRIPVPEFPSSRAAGGAGGPADGVVCPGRHSAAGRQPFSWLEQNADFAAHCRREWRCTLAGGAGRRPPRIAARPDRTGLQQGHRGVGHRPARGSLAGQRQRTGSAGLSPQQSRYLPGASLPRHGTSSGR